MGDQHMETNLAMTVIMTIIINMLDVINILTYERSCGAALRLQRAARAWLASRPTRGGSATEQEQPQAARRAEADVLLEEATRRADRERSNL